MYWVLWAVAITQVVQMLVCNISLLTLFLLIPRILFSLRFVGTMIGLKVLISLEAVGFGMWLVWRGLIVKTLSWPTFIVFLICEIVVCIVYVADTETYLYIVDEDE